MIAPRILIPVLRGDEGEVADVEGVEESWRTAAVTKRGLVWRTRTRVAHEFGDTATPRLVLGLVLGIELATVAVELSPRHCKRI
jgi:hypothetical protein